MYRVWYSTESFADFIIDHTNLKNETVVKNKMYESDANNPGRFHTTPDHIRKILYLDAPDCIVEKDNEPIFSIEVTTEAGTGHNAFQRFARIAAAVENGVPAFYIYPEGAIISRKAKTEMFSKWDELNPLIFRALESVMSIYDIPALLYYFPSDIAEYRDRADKSPNFVNKGLKFDADIVKYSGCPDSSDKSMQDMFAVLNEILEATEKSGVISAREKLLKNIRIRDQRNFMQMEFAKKSKGSSEYDMSPLSAVTYVPTEYILNYLSEYEDSEYQIGELLRSRETTAIYQCNAHFRGDPYPGALAAIDYLVCREGKTFEDRRKNLILLFGALTVDHDHKTIRVADEKDSTIKDFFDAVQSSAKHNLLTKNYEELKSNEIPRYLMQVRYGSTYSKVKHIRVFSYFADAILFPDGSMWRDG
jgi:hypothetical protein